MLYFNEVHGRLGNQRVCASVQRIHIYILYTIVYTKNVCSYIYICKVLSYIYECIHIYIIYATGLQQIVRPGFTVRWRARSTPGVQTYDIYICYIIPNTRSLFDHIPDSTTQVREHGGVRAVYNVMYTKVRHGCDRIMCIILLFITYCFRRHRRRRARAREFVYPSIGRLARISPKLNGQTLTIRYAYTYRQSRSHTIFTNFLSVSIPATIVCSNSSSRKTIISMLLFS